MFFKNYKAAMQKFLEADISRYPNAQRSVIRLAQIVYSCIRDLSDGQISLQAMSLVYTTLITLVPLLAISFSVLKGFGVHSQMEPFLLNLLQGLGPDKSAEVTAQVISFVDNVQVGVLGAVGLAFLIYAVIALMQKIEIAFNYIWRVAEDRTLSERFSDYLSVLLMGPLLIFISAGFTTAVRNSTLITGLENYHQITLLYDIGAFLLPWFVMAVGFTFIYIYMPNTKVRLSAAFTGGLVAAFLWKTMGFVFATFIAGSTNYVAIYAAFATLIVLMIWLYASWLVVLIGANVSFYMQNPRYMRITREPLILSPYLRLALGLSILSLIARAHYKSEPPLTMEALSRQLNVPVLAVQRILEILEKSGIIAASKQEPPRYFPALAFDQEPLQTVIEALEREGRQGWLQSESMNFTAEALKIMRDMNKARQEKITHIPIAQLVMADYAPPPARENITE